MAAPARRFERTEPTPLRPTRPTRRGLAEVAAFLGVVAPAGAGEVVVTGVAQDSRRVLPGDLYVARPGESSHGARFAGAAAAGGAVAAVTDPAGRAPCEAAGLATVVVPDPRNVLGTLSAWTYGEPARHLTCLGVTGTNGKTTTTFLLDAALRHAGLRTGLVGTVESRIGDEARPSARTTPEAPDLQAMLAVMRERDVRAVSMEVSSHALAYGRVDGMVFDVAGFTNLTQDHLEIHGDMEGYFAAKASLFTPEHARLGVVDVDGPYGGRLVGLARDAGTGVVTVSSAGNPAADWWTSDVEHSATGASEFRLHGPDGLEKPVALGVPGDFNVANAVLAAAMLHGAGIALDAFVDAFAAVRFPGRMERIPGPPAFAAIVDYAHTPDAIAAVLAAVRPWTKGRVIAVVGCGGDRDRGKRPRMGEAAARGADVVVVTDDNPRSEDPAAIRAAALAGARDVPAAHRAEVVEIEGRRAAIALALRAARPGDTVLVLGKGHEQGQEIAGVVHPFDDRTVATEELRLLASEGSAGR